MDTYEIRRMALLRAMDAKCDGKQVNLSKRTGIRPDYISRMLGTGQSRKRISGDFARKIEKSLGLPPSWLDQPENATVGASPPLGDAAVHQVQYLQHESLSGKGRGEVFMIQVSEIKGANFDALRFIRVDDPAMTFAAGLHECVVIVDTSARVLTDDEVYMVEHGNRLRPRRMVFTGGEWVARADNPDQTRFPDELQDEDKVIGRVIWASGKL